MTSTVGGGAQAGRDYRFAILDCFAGTLVVQLDLAVSSTTFTPSVCSFKAGVHAAAGKASFEPKKIFCDSISQVPQRLPDWGRKRTISSMASPGAFCTGISCGLLFTIAWPGGCGPSGSGGGSCCGALYSTTTFYMIGTIRIPPIGFTDFTIPPCGLWRDTQRQDFTLEPGGAKHHSSPHVSLTPIPPKYREAILVCLVDKVCSLYEVFALHPYGNWRIQAACSTDFKRTPLWPEVFRKN
ncbi:MAG: hypothetical protein ACLU9S_24635 [Oscillospiraceae bacterium]